jgi:DNA-directed RNA polymerase subunit RPC12/RpoP
LTMKINPRRIILGMMPRSCAECSEIQHVFFRTRKEYDEWNCPVCNERIEPDEDIEEVE